MDLMWMVWMSHCTFHETIIITIEIISGSFHFNGDCLTLLPKRGTLYHHPTLCSLRKVEKTVIHKKIRRAQLNQLWLFRSLMEETMQEVMKSDFCRFVYAIIALIKTAYHLIHDSNKWLLQW